MVELFYYRIDDPEVERLARAICVKRRIDPDELVPDSGYDFAPSIPIWWKYQDQALEFLAMNEAMAEGT